MRRTAPLFAFTLSLGIATSAAAAPPIGYAQSTGYFKKDSRPTLYQPLNLLDGREATAWCSPTSDPIDERLTFGFKGSARIDEVRIYTGNGFDDSTFQEFARAKKLVIRAPTTTQTITLADQRGQQAVAMNPPLEGAQFTVEIQDYFPAEDPESPICITDIVFYADGKPLNGPWLTQKLKYDRAQAPLLGTWFAGSEGAPDKFLSFYFDGSYRFVYDPWDPSMKDKAFDGDFDPVGAKLMLQVPGKKKTSVKLKRAKGKLESGATAQTLELDGEVPAEMRVTFRDQM